MSAAQFAQQTGLKYSTLAGWLQRYRRSQSPGRARAVRLLEAVVEQNADKLPLVLKLPGGARIPGQDRRTRFRQDTRTGEADENILSAIGFALKMGGNAVCPPNWSLYPSGLVSAYPRSGLSGFGVIYAPEYFAGHKSRAEINLKNVRT